MGHGTFLILLAGAVAVGGWVLTQAIFALLERNRRKLQVRLLAVNPDANKKGAAQQAKSVVKPIEQQRRDQAHTLTGFARKLARAHPDLTMGRFLLMVAALAAAFFFAGAFVAGSFVVGFLAALTAAAIPFLVIGSRSAQYQKVIDEQLPDALDFLARILRAGHSLSTGFQMSAEELPDPLAGEFRRCYDQHSLGQPLDDVLRDMAKRMDVPDVSFFVTAVLIQRQTGGDLAEVLKNIGGMVRARMRLQQHVKAITAQGRLTGTILLVMPFAFFFILYLLNPKYAGVLLNTTEGRWVMGFAVMMQVMGLLTIRRIVAVKM
jgi:tight adherence protein B